MKSIYLYLVKLVCLCLACFSVLLPNTFASTTTEVLTEEKALVAMELHSPSTGPPAPLA